MNAFARMMSFCMMAVRASFGGLPFFCEGFVFTFHIWIEPGGDKGGHIDGLSDECPTATNLAFL